MCQFDSVQEADTARFTRFTWSNGHSAITRLLGQCLFFCFLLPYGPMPRVITLIALITTATSDHLRNGPVIYHNMIVDVCVITSVIITKS